MYTEEHHGEDVYQDTASLTVHPAEVVQLRLGGKPGAQA